MTYRQPVCRTLLKDVLSDKRREIMLRHNVQGHLGQLED